MLCPAVTGFHTLPLMGVMGVMGVMVIESDVAHARIESSASTWARTAPVQYLASKRGKIVVLTK